MIGPAFDCALDKCFFSVADYLPAHSFLELKDQPGPDGFNNGGSAALLGEPGRGDRSVSPL